MTVIMKSGKICTEALAKLSIAQLRAFLAIHARAPYPEALGFASEILAAVSKELQSRG